MASFWNRFVGIGTPGGTSWGDMRKKAYQPGSLRRFLGGGGTNQAQVGLSDPALDAIRAEFEEDPKRYAQPSTLASRAAQGLRGATVNTAGDGLGGRPSTSGLPANTVMEAQPPSPVTGLKFDLNEVPQGLTDIPVRPSVRQQTGNVMEAPRTTVVQAGLLGRDRVDGSMGTQFGIPLVNQQVSGLGNETNAVHQAAYDVPRRFGQYSAAATGPTVGVDAMIARRQEAGRQEIANRGGLMANIGSNSMTPPADMSKAGYAPPSRSREETNTLFDAMRRRNINAMAPAERADIFQKEKRAAGLAELGQVMQGRVDVEGKRSEGLVGAAREQATGMALASKYTAEGKSMDALAALASAKMKQDTDVTVANKALAGEAFKAINARMTGNQNLSQKETANLRKYATDSKNARSKEYQKKLAMASSPEEATAITEQYNLWNTSVDKWVDALGDMQYKPEDLNELTKSILPLLISQTN